MELISSSFAAGATVPAENAFCIPDPDTHATFGPNRNPHLAWSVIPAETKSFAITCHDPDAPTRPDDVNQEGREVPADLPRTDFYHWLLIDLPPDVTEIAEAAFADGVVPHGREAARGPYESRQGRNDYTGWFAGNPDMEGDYFGYDGPCPPWNDALIHRYVFTVFALDVATVGVGDGFMAADLNGALKGHVIASVELTGTYTLNPRLG